MNWSHPSLEPRKVYAVQDGRVLKGQMLIALVKGRKVVKPNGEEIGDYESPAQAMLMAARFHEAELEAFRETR